FRSIGYTRNVVILTQPRDYEKKASSRWLWRMLMHSHKAIAEAMSHRHEMYNSQLRLVDEGEKRGDTFVIAPDQPLPIGRVSTDKAKMTHVYNIGRETAERLLPRLTEFLTR
ncbi:MAG: patatin family protein, partial [Muribaculaceae bacterium]|nr:patatin family protein [Muribaculaceae bacterium]